MAVTANSSGQADLLCFPNLATCVWSPRGSVSGGSQVFMYRTSNSTDVFAGTGFGFPTTSLGAMYQRYRIVGWGMRFRPAANISTSGEMIAAPIMTSGTLPPVAGSEPQVRASDGDAYKVPFVTSGFNTEATAPTAASRMAAMGIPYTGSANTAVLSIDALATLPGHGVMTQSELAVQGVHGRSKPFAPSAHEFRNIQFWNAGTDAVDNAGGALTTTSASWALDLSYLRCDGWTSSVVGFTGYPASSSIGTLELIYHVEATVVPTSGADMGVRAAVGSAICDAQEYDAHRAVIAKAPHFSTAALAKQGEDLVYGAIEGLANDAATRMGNTLLGRLGSLMSGLSIA